MENNKVIKNLILTDIAFWTGWGMITPVFAIFVVDRVIGGTALTVGIATAIYWILRASLVFPFAKILDKYAGDKDDYLFLVFGNFLAALVPFGYIFAIYPWHIYALQVIYGVGIAMSLVGWRAIFTRNITKGKEASEWAMDDASLSVGVALAGIFTGFVITQWGYIVAFSIAGFLAMMSVVILLCLRKQIEGVFNRKFPFNIVDIFRGK
ncbi:MAG: MFS transporter [Candidatus Paceibacterota bacterium]|jgi:MFS family permease